MTQPSTIAGTAHATSSFEAFEPAVLRAVLESLPDTVVLVDRRGRIVACNRAITTLLGYDPGDLVGRSVDLLLPAHLRTRHQRRRAKYIRQPRVRTMGEGLDLRAARADGSTVPVDIHLGPVDGDTGLVCCILRDATVRVHDEERLRRLAEEDPLTGLLNRRAFEVRVADLLALAGRSGEPFTLALVDLDDFKSINDAHGHAAGDQALCAVADEVRSRLRTSDVSARLGGDEFVVALPGSDVAEAQLVVADLQRSFRGRGDDLGFALAASFGLAAFPRDGRHLDQLLERADTELYAAKADRRGETGKRSR